MSWCATATSGPSNSKTVAPRRFSPGMSGWLSGPTRNPDDALQTYPAQDRIHPHGQFSQAERFGQVVICATGQAGNAVLLIPQCRQQHHRHPVLLTQCSQQRQAIQARQQDIQQHQVKASGTGGLQPVVPAPAQGDEMPLLSQMVLHTLAQQRIVFDQQQASGHQGGSIHGQREPGAFNNGCQILRIIIL